MHLRDTSTEMKYQGATAYVSCIWLSDDRAVPSTGNDSYRAALAFVGPDVSAYGFVPAKKLIYVVSSQGTYLIPYKVGPAKNR